MALAILNEEIEHETLFSEYFGEVPSDTSAEARLAMALRAPLRGRGPFLSVAFRKLCRADGIPRGQTKFVYTDGKSVIALCGICNHQQNRSKTGGCGITCCIVRAKTATSKCSH
jgi:hypothetical protein